MEETASLSRRFFQRTGSWGRPGPADCPTARRKHRVVEYARRHPRRRFGIALEASATDVVAYDWLSTLSPCAEQRREIHCIDDAIRVEIGGTWRGWWRHELDEADVVDVAVVGGDAKHWRIDNAHRIQR